MDVEASSITQRLGAAPGVQMGSVTSAPATAPAPVTLDATRKTSLSARLGKPGPGTAARQEASVTQNAAAPQRSGGIFSRLSK